MYHIGWIIYEYLPYNDARTSDRLCALFVGLSLCRVSVT